MTRVTERRGRYAVAEPSCHKLMFGLNLSRFHCTRISTGDMRAVAGCVVLLENALIVSEGVLSPRLQCLLKDGLDLRPFVYCMLSGTPVATCRPG